MPHAVHPRRLLKATYDVKEEWSRALFDAFGPGGLLARETPEFGREHLLWALAQLRAVNGRTGAMFTGDTEIAQRLGYNTKDHPGKACRDTLTRIGFFTQHGKVSRAANLRLSAPVVILDDYGTLAGAAEGDVIIVADTKPSRPRRKAGAVDAASRPADASVIGTCPVHPEGNCPDPNDPFSYSVPWDMEVCVRRQAA
ncbi:hypothetical protein ACFVFQ_16170 [Streptomyces sp. NPDC057743]|uniref:hypothetical protein n=1 Tax=Streptomyces sp. NPDC057743 TaxID=3346236 RepID=UPI003687A344